MYEYKKLRLRIIEKYDLNSNFAKALGVSEVSVSKKLNCRTGFSQKDIEKWSGLLSISKDEYPEYFFK